MRAHDVDALIGRGQGLIQARREVEAIQTFADAYAMAVVTGERHAAAHAMLGQAQAEFAVHRLAAAAQHARAAFDLLTGLAMPQAKHAADLIVQIDHYRDLRERGVNPR